MSQPLTPKFLTPEIAALVVDWVFTNLLQADMHVPSTLMRRKQGHMVILVPSMDDVREADYPDWPDYPIRPHLLYERSAGEEADWEHPFKDIAQCKALQLWQGRNTDGQTDSNAHLLFPNDTPYWGGVARHGLVVAFSGEEPWIDQMLAGMVADMLKAIGRDSFETSTDKADGLSFLT